MKIFNPLIWCLLLMVGVTAATSILIFGDWLKKELFFSWSLNLFNAYLFAAISRRAVGKELNTFLAWSLLGNGIRFLVVLGAIGTVIMADWGDPVAVITFILSGYLIFMVGEILDLVRLNR